jgi:hypothetical protein
MLVDDKFIFISIPRCATLSFEYTCISNGLELDFNPHSLATKQLKINGTPTYHSHTKYSAYKDLYGDKYPIITITRDPVDRFISGWKYVLLEVKTLDIKLYNRLVNLTNEEFMFYFLNYFKNLRFNENKIIEFFNQFVSDFKLNRNLLVKIKTILVDNSFWTENSNDIIYFNFENELPKLEQWVSEKCNIDFKMLSVNDSKKVNLTLTKNQRFIDFYHQELFPTRIEKMEISLI